MKKTSAILLCIMLLAAGVYAEEPSTEDRIAAIEMRMDMLEELLRSIVPPQNEADPESVTVFRTGDPRFAEGTVWYSNAEKGIVLKCTDFYYNNTNRGQIVITFIVQNGSNETIQFSAQNVYINGWLHSTSVNLAALDKLQPQSSMRDSVQLTDLIDGRIDGINELDDIKKVQEIRFELVLRTDGKETERIPVVMSNLNTMEEKPW